MRSEKDQGRSPSGFSDDNYSRGKSIVILINTGSGKLPQRHLKATLKNISLNKSIVYLVRYTFEKDGKMCTLRIKECRPDDECEYACGVDEKRSRARLFVDGKLFIYRHFHTALLTPTPALTGTLSKYIFVFS